MALATFGGISQRTMTGRRRGIVIFGVTTYTFCGKSEPIELTDRSHLVARVAVHDCVGADEGESILMLVDVVNGNLPTISGVTELALGAVLSAMKICMALLAF